MKHEVRQNWQLWSGAIDDNACDAIIEESRKYPEERGFIFSDRDSENPHRKSNVRWLSECQEVGTLLWDYTEKANQVLGVNVEPLAEIQYTEYVGSEGGHYGYHHDVDWSRNDNYDRKLSITVQLSCPSEYTGGEFQFTEVENPPMDALKKRGSVLVFPSYLVHAVSPVTRGLRRSVVAWFEGPTWK